MCFEMYFRPGLNGFPAANSATKAEAARFLNKPLNRFIELRQAGVGADRLTPTCRRYFVATATCISQPWATWWDHASLARPLEDDPSRHRRGNIPRISESTAASGIGHASVSPQQFRAPFASNHSSTGQLDRDCRRHDGLGACL